MLRLSACPSLSRLPPSICKLGQLEYVDISRCRSLNVLPAEFYGLSNLETLDMRECTGLKKLPIVRLRSLKRVIISDSDKESQEVWLSIKESGIQNLMIAVVAQLFSLDWLYAWLEGLLKYILCQLLESDERHHRCILRAITSLYFMYMEIEVYWPNIFSNFSNHSWMRS